MKVDDILVRNLKSEQKLLLLLCHRIKINIQTPGSDQLYCSFCHAN